MDIASTMRYNLSEEQNLLLNAVKINRHRSRKFLKKAYELKCFAFKDKDDCFISEDLNIEKFFILLDVFEDKYKENMDLDFYYENGLLYPYFKVLYPSITITNSESRVHHISDLLVIHKVLWQGHDFITDHPLGLRLKREGLEIESGYVHSHLPSSNSQNWLSNPFVANRFCLGGSTDVSSMINGEFRCEEIDWARYELYLFCIDSMLSWESLEGVPHIKMEKIKMVLNTVVDSFNLSIGKKIFSYIFKQKIPLDVDFYIDSYLFKIKENEKSNDFLKQIILENFNEFKGLLVYRIENSYNKFVCAQTKKTLQEKPILINPKFHTYLQGRKLFAKTVNVHPKNFTENEKKEPIVYPNLLKYVFTKLERELYLKTLTKSGINFKNSLDNSPRSVSSNTISV
jgi:hypothetical protein